LSREESFTEQEQRRLEAEKRVNEFKRGAPLSGSLEEFMDKFKSDLEANPLLKEFMTRSYAEVKDVVEALRRFIMEQETEQNSGIEQLTSEVAGLRQDVRELNDNFNLFMSKLLDQNTERLQLVRQAVANINRALS
jgi:archaellum component FlaC